MNAEETGSSSGEDEASKGSGPGPLSGPTALAALGVVFGDIGTSPLYTLQACFTTAHAAPSAANVVGIISALVWTLVLVVCIKYVTFVMRVDYHGEGGILALLARLITPIRNGVFPPLGPLTLIAIVGAAALLGDGIITPAISVLSAVEGLGTIAPGAAQWEVPITLAILFALFVSQARGTQAIGVVFGPVMALWFVATAAFGVRAILAKPEIFAALDPRHAVWFVTHHGVFGFLVFGATILCVTGAEALYADMSHFGRRAITVTWYGIVFPALVLNYLGQGALLLRSSRDLEHAFFSLTAGWTLIPMVVLATAATVIASQAVITGAFTVMEQAIALELAPRMRVNHTSHRYPGQVYVPAMNVLVGIGCLSLVVVFRSSSALAAAYGLAVALTMAATSVLFCVVARSELGWNAIGTAILAVFLFLLDGSFVTSGLAKVPAGGWIPLAIAALGTLVATTWYTGRRAVLSRLAADTVPVERFLADVQQAQRVEGTAVFFTNRSTEVPHILHNHLARVGTLAERVVVLTLTPSSKPYLSDADRVTITPLGDDVLRIEARFGFMELPSLEPIVKACGAHGLHIDDESTSYVASLPLVVPGRRNALAAARRWLFAAMHKLVGPFPEHLGIPPDSLLEVGTEVRY